MTLYSYDMLKYLPNAHACRMTEFTTVLFSNCRGTPRAKATWCYFKSCEPTNSLSMFFLNTNHYFILN